MGTFVSLSGVVGGRREPVADALRAYAESHGGALTEAPPALEDDETLILCEASGGVTAFYPRDFFEWDGASQLLSEHLDAPVFSLHIHDGDLWMYILYEKGTVIDRFNPMPDYWAEIDDQERRSWLGNASIVASRAPGLLPEQVSRYLVPWTDDLADTEEKTKAYPTDEWCYGDDWQMVDFMSKLRLDYPLVRGEIRGTKYRFTCKSRF